METCLSIGVCVRPEDEARLTAIIESMQKNAPGTSDDECVDLIFRVGMEFADLFAIAHEEQTP